VSVIATDRLTIVCPRPCDAAELKESLLTRAEWCGQQLVHDRRRPERTTKRKGRTLYCLVLTDKPLPGILPENVETVIRQPHQADITEPPKKRGRK